MYFTIRHPSAVTASTTYTTTGEVEMGDFVIPLSTQASAQQDNFIAITRPVDVSLDNLNLGGTSAFISSTSETTFGRRDQLMVFDNTVQAQNKSATAIYFYHGGIWKKSGAGSTNYGTDVIRAGSGFMIRKYQSGDGSTAFWKNTSPY